MDISKVELPEVRRAAAEEAVRHLGLLKPSAMKIIEELLTDFDGYSPAKVAEAYLGAGRQVGLSELSKLGLQPHRRFSAEAMSKLSKRGLKRAGPAFRLTLSRAYYSLHRYSWPLSWDQKFQGPSGPEPLFYYPFGRGLCEVCLSLNGVLIDRENMVVLPPAGCDCDEASIMVRTAGPRDAISKP